MPSGATSWIKTSFRYQGPAGCSFLAPAPELHPTNAALRLLSAWVDSDTKIPEGIAVVAHQWRAE